MGKVIFNLELIGKYIILIHIWGNTCTVYSYCRTMYTYVFFLSKPDVACRIVHCARAPPFWICGFAEFLPEFLLLQIVVFDVQRARIVETGDELLSLKMAEAEKNQEVAADGLVPKLEEEEYEEVVSSSGKQEEEEQLVVEKIPEKQEDLMEKLESLTVTKVAEKAEDMADKPEIVVNSERQQLDPAVEAETEIKKVRTCA